MYVWNEIRKDRNTEVKRYKGRRAINRVSERQNIGKREEWKDGRTESTKWQKEKGQRQNYERTGIQEKDKRRGWTDRQIDGQTKIWKD
jgi:hypothetical protein